VRRRDVITLLGGAAAWPLAAEAQQAARVRRIGVLLGYPEGDTEAQSRIAAFEQGLKSLGWTKGRNAQITYHFGAVDSGRMPDYARDLISQRPEVLVATGGNALAELRRATSTIPIVVAVAGDLVEMGYVESLAHPGGNITGFSSFEFTLGGKWLDLLHEVAPSVNRVMILQPPTPRQPQRGSYVPSIEAAARRIDVVITKSDLHSDTDIGPTVDQFASEPNSGMIVIPGLFTGVHRRAIVGASARNRLPAIYPYPYFVGEGGLLAYGSDSRDIVRRAAGYVDRILKGEKPADLPVQTPVKFELVINLKTAKALGLEMPATVLSRADEVFE
jgi:putative tryptophan/tyrosine transport system substrate-binding protein